LGLNRETAHNVFVFQSLTPGHAVMQLGQAHNPEVCVCGRACIIQYIFSLDLICTRTGYEGNNSSKTEYIQISIYNKSQICSYYEYTQQLTWTFEIKNHNFMDLALINDCFYSILIKYYELNSVCFISRKKEKK